MHLVAKLCFTGTHGDQLCLLQSNLTTEQLGEETRFRGPYRGVGGGREAPYRLAMVSVLSSVFCLSQSLGHIRVKLAREKRTGSHRLAFKSQMTVFHSMPNTLRRVTAF